MKYGKPPLTFQKQVEHLRAHGLEGDEARIERKLESVNYYRLSAYWHNLRQPDGLLRPGTTFEDIWARYAFDRALRLHVMDALERVEIAVRARLAYSLGHRHGPFGYACDPAVLWRKESDRRLELLLRIREEISRSQEPFVDHFRQKYGDAHKDLPIWMAMELMSFGTMLTLYRACDGQVRGEVAAYFGVADEVMESWLHTLNVVRNTCAHHARLWNRVLGVKPKLPRAFADPDWHQPVRVENNRAFGVLTILCYGLQRIAPRSGWATRLNVLFRDSPKIPKKDMGFPDNWEDCPIWARMLVNG